MLVPLGHPWRYATGLSGDPYADPGFDDSAWDLAPTPFGWAYAGVTVVPSPMNVWYRTTVSTSGGNLVLFDEHADNSTQVYVDGVLRATMATIAGEGVTTVITVDAGDHVIAVHGTDDGVAGGYSGLTIEDLGVPSGPTLRGRQRGDGRGSSTASRGRQLGSRQASLRGRAFL